VHPPPGFPGLEPFDVAQRIRMLAQSFDMLSDNAPVFLGPLPDESPDILLDLYPHDLPRLKTEIFLGFFPGNVLGIFINLIQIPLKRTELVFCNESSYRIPKAFSGFLQPRESSPRAWSKSYPLVRNFLGLDCGLLHDSFRPFCLFVQCHARFDWSTVQNFTVVQSWLVPKKNIVIASHPGCEEGKTGTEI